MRGSERVRVYQKPQGINYAYVTLDECGLLVGVALVWGLLSARLTGHQAQQVNWKEAKRS